MTSSHSQQSDVDTRTLWWIRVTLAFAVIIGGGVWRAAEKVSDIEDKLELKFVTKEVFESEMRNLRESLSDLKGEVRSLRDERPQESK